MTRYISPHLKRLVFSKYGGMCANTCKWKCDLNGKKLKAGQYEFDHIVEYSRGGQTTLDNLQLLCRNCHGIKTHKFMKKKTYKKFEDAVPPEVPKPKKLRNFRNYEPDTLYYCDSDTDYEEYFKDCK